MTSRKVSTSWTRNTSAFAAFLLALWYAAVSQGNGAAYALFFFVVALAMVSWVHARRNLRGVTFRAGRIEPVFVGGEMHVPLTVIASSGNFVSGLEIRAFQGKEVARAGFIAAGQSVEVSVTVPAVRRGALPSLELELRSRWPVGLFAAVATIRLEAPHVIHPTPIGSQPLPEGEPGWLYDRRRGRGNGDEFAGLREFRQGESPRRIHWRSAERSDKLLVTEWEGAAGGLRWLNWADLETSGTEERLAQLTRWVLDADRSGAPYGLRLPGAEIQPALGPAHRSRCLSAIAAYPVAPATPLKAKKTKRFDPPILPGPFAGVLIAIGLSVLPIATTVLPFSLGLFIVSVLFRLITRRRGIAVRSAPAKLLVCGIGVGGVMISGAGLIGLEPGMSLVLSLIALKVLETDSRRDFFVLVLLTWFIALCGLFVSQSLIAGLVAVVICIIAAAAASTLNGEDQIPWRLSFRRVGLMALQGIPVIALMFLFFPRVQGGFRLSLKPGGLGSTGFSEDFDPGSFAKLNDNYDSAFRAEFLEGEPPKAADRYWRGLVLWDCHGLEWRKGSVFAIEPRATKAPPGAFRHRVTIQPHGARWVFVLDRPLFAARETTMEPGAYLQASRPINRSTRFEVVSLPKYEDEILRTEQRRAALRLPRNLPAATSRLAESWKSAGTDAQILEQGIRWFQAQGFTYSLTPDRYSGANAMDDFLFRRRTGFCSHYASAFATLMRIAGLPARVVLGYQGGQYNPHGSYFLVRQNDAHAWCEVWIEGHGWQRVDLTQILAPGRIEDGADSYRDAADELSGGFRPPAGLVDLFGKARLLWDNLNYQWDVRVVAFDEDSQFELLANIGLKDVPRPVLMVGTVTVSFLLLGVAGLWLRRVTRPRRDAAGEAWLKTCAQIGRVSGLPREAWEGPQAYATRAIEARPDASAIIKEATDVYARIRFGQHPPPLNELLAATERLARLSPAKAARR
ncbi:MAG TPA: transglutaminaseTgpA domain-containing protein [Chthoniobacteraceae bacterium]|nr:transglutaminaseTgpA domain-containing protein [Chthoniobacteraceae bacterium]